MKKRLIALTLMTAGMTLILVANLSAINSKAGTAAYSFLKLAVSARAAALGNAFVGMADDESAIYYNPAGIRQMPGHALSSGYHNYIADIQGGYLSAVFPWGLKRKLGLAVNYLSYGSISRTSSEGAVLGEFGGGDLAISVAVAQKIIDNLDFGLTTKFIYESIDSFNSTGLAVDLGVLYRFSDGHTSLGLSASNLGVQLSGLSDKHQDPLPMVIKAGVAHRMYGAPLNAIADVGKYSDNNFFAGGGVEFVGIEALRLRLGYTTLGLDYKTGGSKENLAGFTFGIGFLLKKLAFDYAYIPYADLGGSHRIYIARRW